jgi:hypothetical protein
VLPPGTLLRSYIYTVSRLFLMASNIFYMANKKIVGWRIKKVDTAVKGRKLINIRSQKCLWGTSHQLTPHPQLTRRHSHTGRGGFERTSLLPLPPMGEVTPKVWVRGYKDCPLHESLEIIILIYVLLILLCNNK